MLDTCGDAENRLAMELSQHEVQIEREVLDPLCLLTEVSHFNLVEEINLDWYINWAKSVYLIFNNKTGLRHNALVLKVDINPTKCSLFQYTI